MQGKGLVKLFLILISSVCLLQFAYFIPTNRVENAAEEYAMKFAGTNTDASANKEYKMAKAKYLDSVSGLKLFTIPMIKSYTYSDLKKQQLALGLDLKGGMSAVLQVDLADFLKSLAGRNANNADFQKALDNANQALKSSQSDYITLFSDEFRKLAGNDKLARIFARSETLGEINTASDDGVVTRLLRQKANETVKLTFERLKKRIDKLGVAQPNVSLDPNRDIIIVEMPGIDNPARARQFLQASAKLEFWETFRYSDPGISQALQLADVASNSGLSSSDSSSISIASVMKDSIIYDNLGKAIDTVKVAADSALPTTKSGALLSALTLNGGTLPPSVIGLADKSKKTLINSILSKEDVLSLFPKNSKFMWSYKPSQDGNGVLTSNYELYLIKKQTNTDEAPLDGDVVTSGVQTLNPVNGEVEVNLRMNAAGAKKWAEMTTKAANDGNREIAIALDNEVVSAPRVNGAITQGSSSITGNFSVDEAVDFASILEVGKLPARTNIIQESNVGPSLGKANITKSVNSLLIGFLLVILTMLAYYAGAGIIAIVSLLLNVFLIFGTLSSFGTVLTLSGIAGIVLTIGMAVDANVIIYERIKEELAAGKSLKQAVTDGFYHSYSAIIDANVTTVLTAMILAYFGLGPVKGFAVVLIIGVLCSVFTAVFISRLIIEWWLGKGKDISFWTNFSKGAFKNININWIGKRKIAYVFSGAIILAGIVSMFTRGFDLGVDYKGGFSYNIQFLSSDGMNSDKLRDGLTKSFGTAPVVKQVDADNTFQVTTSYLISETAEDTPARVMAKLFEGVSSISGSKVSLEDFSNTETEADKVHVISSAQVGPTIADDLKRSSLYAGLFALLAVFLYILLRFSKWQYSAGAIIALFHDALFVLSIFSLFYGILPFSLEVDQAFIAAILTVIGYSINDTVIIFDRIREYFSLHVADTKDEIINRAINSTLSRTLMTAFTTVVVILILFLFGGASIKGFAFALLIGIVVGTYSSVFIAAPILHDLASDLKITKKIKPRANKQDGKAFSRAAK
ncbi:MAG: protein translocase subunit SecDF [Saprospiraceae bacterium]|jgi:SecD/SecF fusion protein|nr:protein translocase subunit SecDF [Saprospiraceae bacterium]